MTKPCLVCGVPTDASHCTEHQPAPWQHRESSARSRGYSTSWDKLSRRARRLQPFCTDCGTTDDLQLDHTARTWERIDQGKVVRLKDTGGVVCGPCNVERGAARGRTDDQGTGPSRGAPGPRGKAQSPSHTARRIGGRRGWLLLAGSKHQEQHDPDNDGDHNKEKPDEQQSSHVRNNTGSLP